MYLIPVYVLVLVLSIVLSVAVHKRQKRKRQKEVAQELAREAERQRLLEEARQKEEAYKQELLAKRKTAESLLLEFKKAEVNNDFESTLVTLEKALSEVPGDTEAFNLWWMPSSVWIPNWKTSCALSARRFWRSFSGTNKR